MGKTIKVVLDTNVIVSALLWQGTTRKIFDLADQKKIAIATSTAIIGELNRVLDYPQIAKQLNEINLSKNKVIERFVSQAAQITSEDLPIIVIKDDPADDKILSCAILAGLGKNDFIVSGDHHLLDLQKYQDIPIANPRKFLDKFF